MCVDRPSALLGRLRRQLGVGDRLRFWRRAPNRSTPTSKSTHAPNLRHRADPHSLSSPALVDPSPVGPIDACPGCFFSITDRLDRPSFHFHPSTLTGPSPLVVSCQSLAAIFTSLVVAPTNPEEGATTSFSTLFCGRGAGVGWATKRQPWCGHRHCGTNPIQPLQHRQRPGNERPLAGSNAPGGGGRCCRPCCLWECWCWCSCRRGRWRLCFEPLREDSSRL